MYSYAFCKYVHIAKRLIYAWRYVDRVHASSEEEYLLAPDHHTGEIALARRQAANQHLASCEAEEEALCRCAGKRPRTRALVAGRKRSCERCGFRRSIIFVS